MNRTETKHKLLIVDDEPANLRLLERLFRRDYQVFTAASGAEALELLGQHEVALLITDQRMPGMTGIELLKSTVALRPHMIRIILTGYTDVAALVEAINCGHVYKYVTKPWDNDALRVTVERALEHYETAKSRHELEQANRRLSARLEAMTRGVVRAIADALDAKDEFICGHARRVSGYSAAVARRMRLDRVRTEELSLAAFLHDVGAIGTPDALLLKTGPLSDEERAVVEFHAERGARILSSVPELADMAETVRYHHENYDGTGYPEGLAGEQIPLASRIIRVADAYDAMTSPRPFREAYDHHEAVARLRADSGRKFDPEVVAAFCDFESLAKIRRSIAEGFFGPRFTPASPFEGRPTFEELIRQVETDPVWAAGVLRRARARAGGAFSGGPLNLRAACERLGEAEVVAAGRPTVGVCSMGGGGLRAHSVRSAVAARALAERTRLLDPEEAYALGLMHDVGEALLRSLFPEEMENILWLGAGDQAQREAAAFGVDHGQVGQWILEACGVPRRLASAVQAHHDAMRINDPAALLLHVADAVAHADGGDQLSPLDELGSDRLSLLRLTRADLARVRERVAAEAADAACEPDAALAQT
jgi:putative two-component system response regulator